MTTHGVARLHQPVEHRQQLPDVLEVQAGGGLVEDVERAAGGDPRQLARELDALRLAAGQGGRALAEPDVAEPHVVQRLQHAHDVPVHGEVLHRLAHAHLQHLGDVLALVADPQRGVVEALALAHLAGHVDVGEEVHLHQLHAVALARLAAAALHVEAEAARRVAERARLRRQREDLADGVEHLGVRRRVAARRAADGPLVDVDHLVEVLDPAEWPCACPAPRALP